MRSAPIPNRSNALRANSAVVACGLPSSAASAVRPLVFSSRRASWCAPLPSKKSSTCCCTAAGFVPVNVLEKPVDGIASTTCWPNAEACIVTAFGIPM